MSNVATYIYIYIYILIYGQLFTFLVVLERETPAALILTSNINNSFENENHHRKINTTMVK